MGVRINTNVEAMNAQRHLGLTAMAYGKSVEKLSSGLRINRAADDAAGLAISEKLRAQVNGLDQASRNAQDAISMVQTAEGALNEVHASLQRIRELAVQYNNGTLGTDEQNAITDEVAQLTAGITDVLTQTSFNGAKLLNGTAGVAADGVVSYQVGANANETLSVTFGNVATDVGTLDGTDIQAVDDAIVAVSKDRDAFGAAQNRLESTNRNLGVASSNMSASESRIRDVDVASEMVNFTKLGIMQQAGTAVLAQANQAPQTILSLLR